FDREPLHWPLEFPEVFAQGGFDAIIGNPPFLGGQKLTGALGHAYRERLVSAIGRNARGSADLVAYFLLRAHDLLNPGGQTGLIATNTLAQGDTREVGLDQLAAGAVTLRQAIKSQPWPSQSAALEFCAVWSSLAALGATAERRADGVVVAGITPSLEAESRVTGNPHRLQGSSGISFIGSYVLGLGFTMTPAEAAALITKDERNRDVLCPYLNGQDLNSRPDNSGSRWVINFHDWSEDQARTYPDCYDQVRRLVKPERDKNNRKPRRERWWQFAERAPAVYQAIAGLGRVVVITRVSKTVIPVLVPTGQVISEAVVVFATDDPALLALLSSAPHYWWAVGRASSMKADLRYTPSDVFETFALPELTPELRVLGDRLDTYRRNVMLSRQAGLTATYNLVFDPGCNDDDIVELRRIHRDIDEATCRAYGWDDLVVQGLDHGFHSAGAYTRYTIGLAAQREILDRLLELNHQRYTKEKSQGLHDKKKVGRKSQSGQPGLF
ncbi:type IIL restriction-modification enzyme MmeI, partial [Micromonospora musae]|uniref:Eco57I restriction-modification methylase domain-containing protein n=1 Tax=Micromonospora musae TaxID=1894970 RepID=UPI0033FD0D38